MEIANKNDVPDTTYFRTDDCSPFFEDGVLYVYNGRGARRFWGCPQVTSTAIVSGLDDITSVHVGFSHKHGGGQFYRHYRKEDQVAWRCLTDSERAIIIDGYKRMAPSWAKSPGKLKSEYLPNCKKVEYDNGGNIIGYKYLIFNKDGVFSPCPAANNAEWINGHIISDKIPDDENSNGIYCSKNKLSPILDGYSKYVNSKLVRIMLCGVVIEFDYGYRAEEAYILETLP